MICSGFEERIWNKSWKFSTTKTVVIACSVFSHFAGSDEKRFDDYSHRQIETFSRCADYLQQHSKHKILRHILNTAGILRFPEYQMDMVRLGIGLHESPYRHTLRAGNSQHIEKQLSFKSRHCLPEKP